MLCIPFDANRTLHPMIHACSSQKTELNSSFTRWWNDLRSDSSLYKLRKVWYICALSSCDHITSIGKYLVDANYQTSFRHVPLSFSVVLFRLEAWYTGIPGFSLNNEGSVRVQILHPKQNGTSDLALRGLLCIPCFSQAFLWFKHWRMVYIP